jgi:pimeloyl-ACP methyl ester carboxylesterase
MTSYIKLNCILLALLLWSSRPTFAQDTLYADAGGFEIRLLKKGSGNSPTVIMENGMFMRLERWFGLDDSLANQATVVTYDRAFLGKSGKGNTKRSGEVVAAELQFVLENAGIKPPYILVGFSLGGYYAKAFVRANPDHTKGLLLIDPLNTEAFYRDFKDDFADLYQFEIESLTLKEDDPRFYEGEFVFGENYGNDGVPPNIPVHLLIAALAPKLPENEDSLYENYDEDNSASQKLWVDHQLKWASHYPNVKFMVVEDASHCIHCTRMDVVLEAFDELMQTVKY